MKKTIQFTLGVTLYTLVFYIIVKEPNLGFIITASIFWNLLLLVGKELREGKGNQVFGFAKRWFE